jgi:hypothetical protein
VKRSSLPHSLIDGPKAVVAGTGGTELFEAWLIRDFGDSGLSGGISSKSVDQISESSEASASSELETSVSSCSLCSCYVPFIESCLACWPGFPSESRFLLLGSPATLPAVDSVYTVREFSRHEATNA